MLVSAIEKKPEARSSTASAPKSQPRGMDCKGALTALENQLEHDLAADVGEKQHREPGEGPDHGGAAPPAAQVMAGEQPPEDEPREDREDGLVREGQRLAEELLR